MRFTKTLVGTFASLLLAGACNGMGSSTSSLSGQDGGVQAGDCTLTQGYWKNHEEAWPVTSLTLGNHSYDGAALLEILRTPVRGNGLISLAHQLIAAKLNVAAGADGASIDASIDAADDLIGDLAIGVDSVPTRDVSGLVGELDAFNNGDTGPGHCDDAPPPPPPTCDAGSDCDGECDGDCPEPPPTCDAGNDCGGSCDSDCPVPPPAPVCGNGVVEDGEACDDGGVVAGDGCSSTCEIEVSSCGNGIVEDGEECDDGNLVDGDGCSSACICD